LCRRGEGGVRRLPKGSVCYARRRQERRRGGTVSSRRGVRGSGHAEGRVKIKKISTIPGRGGEGGFEGF